MNKIDKFTKIAMLAASSLGLLGWINISKSPISPTIQ